MGSPNPGADVQDENADALILAEQREAILALVEELGPSATVHDALNYMRMAKVRWKSVKYSVYMRDKSVHARSRLVMTGCRHVVCASQ